MSDFDELAAERPCRHDWYESGEKEYWPDEGGLELRDPVYLTQWTCWKCGDTTVTEAGDHPNPAVPRQETEE